MRQGSFSINSVIITDVRRDDRGGLMLLVNRSPVLDSSGELAWFRLMEVLGQVSYLFTLLLLLLMVIMAFFFFLHRGGLHLSPPELHLSAKNMTNDTLEEEESKCTPALASHGPTRPAPSCVSRLRSQIPGK